MLYIITWTEEHKFKYLEYSRKLKYEYFKDPIKRSNDRNLTSSLRQKTWEMSQVSLNTWTLTLKKNFDRISKLYFVSSKINEFLIYSL